MLKMSYLIIEPNYDELECEILRDGCTNNFTHSRKRIRSKGYMVKKLLQFQNFWRPPKNTSKSDMGH